MVPIAPGTYRYTPDMPDAEPGEVEVVEYKGALFARLFDGDEFELHPVGDLSGAWAGPLTGR